MVFGHLGVALALALAAAEAAFAAAPDGPYGVGFETIEARDASRGAFEGAASGDPPAGRPLTLYVWRPAKKGSGRAADFSLYVDAFGAGQARSLGEFSETADGAALFAARVAEMGGALPADDIRGAFGRQPVAARVDAAPAEGRFPVVVFPDYSAPASNSQLAERLASHGYVVVSLNLFGARDPGFTADLAGVEAVADDVQFAIGEAARTPYADVSKVAVMGVGIAGSSALSMAMRSSAVGAFVSLDSGVPTPFEDEMLKRAPFFDYANVRIPILAIMSTHESVDPAFWDQYRYADRYLSVWPSVSEHHTLNYGAWSAERPNIIGAAAQETTPEGNRWQGRYIVEFLNWTLKGDRAGEQFMARAADRNGVPEGLVSLDQRRPALATPPSLSAVKQIIARDGVEGFAELYRRLRENDPEPYGPATFATLDFWLAARDGEDRGARIALARLRLEGFPGNARATYALAQTLRGAGETEEARALFQETIRLLAVDTDPTLTEDRKARIRTAAEAALSAIG